MALKFWKETDKLICVKFQVKIRTREESWAELEVREEPVCVCMGDGGEPLLYTGDQRRPSNKLHLIRAWKKWGRELYAWWLLGMCWMTKGISTWPPALQGRYCYPTERWNSLRKQLAQVRQLQAGKIQCWLRCVFRGLLSTTTSFRQRHLIR